MTPAAACEAVSSALLNIADLIIAIRGDLDPERGLSGPDATLTSLKWAPPTVARESEWVAY